MITDTFLEQVATFSSSIIRSTAVVSIEGKPDLVVPLTVTQSGKVINCSFVIDNTVEGKITNITVMDNNDAPIEVNTINFTKILGTIFVGAFKFTIKEGERT